ncbi:MAG: cardiolipin synthase [Candidatus Azobacteroides sp.]|nr:cardiolipin synthase [Candidatus Azobacteroides sp.]
MDTKAWIIFLLQIILIIIIIQIICVIISENRNPNKTISWILILTFLPGIGLLLYFLFGEEHRKKYKIVKKLSRGLNVDALPDMHLFSSSCYPEEYEKLVRLLQTLNDALVLAGNKVSFYVDGKEKFRQFFEDISRAKHHIHILYYKIIDDKLGQEFKDILIRKAKEGIEVRVIYDDVGSLRTKKHYFSELKKEGVEVEPYLQVRIPRIARRLNYRNHRKLAVIDGIIGYIGGMNIADCYVEGVSWGIWRDMQLRIEGKGTYGLQKVFLLDWYFAHKTVPEIAPYFPPVEHDSDKNPLQVISSGPVDIYNCIEKGIFQAITSARKSIYIQTPYFIPSENILQALQTSAMSGVDIHIVIPKKSDNYFVDGATYSFVKDLLNYNIHVYLYCKGFIHSKCLIIDESLTISGSANMDIRSFELSFESNVFIYDKETAEEATLIFWNDVKDSLKLNLKNWLRRPLWRRFFESVMRIFTPLL